MNIKNIFKKKIFLIIFSIGLTSSIVGISLYIANFYLWRKTKIFHKDFSLKNNIFLRDIDEKKKNNLTIFLEKKYIKQQSKAFFYKNSIIYNYIEYYDLLETSQLAKNQKIYNFLANNFEINIDLFQNINMLDFISYLQIIKLLNKTIPINAKKNITLYLKNHFDTNDNLYFLNNIEDPLGNKLVITAKIIDALNSNSLLLYEGDSIRQTIINFYKSVEFIDYANAKSFFNSGGDVLFALSKIDNYQNIFSIKNKKKWLESWVNYFEQPIASNFELSQTIDGYNLINKFHQNASIKILKNIKTYVDQKINNNVDSNISNILFNTIEKIDGMEIKNSKLLAIINEQLVIDSKKIIIIDYSPDAESTAYGFIMSLGLNKNLDKTLLMNYVKELYDIGNLLVQKKSYTLASRNFYFGLIIHQLVDLNSISSYTKNIIQNVTTIMENSNDIFTLFNATETLFALPLSHSPIKIEINTLIKENLFKKIKDIKKNNEIHNHLLITFLFLIDQKFKFNLITQNDIKKAIDNLKYNDGIRLTSTDKKASLISAYLFSIIKNNSIKNQLPTLQKFLDSRQEKAGIFINDNGVKTLFSTFIGLSTEAFISKKKITKKWNYLNVES